VIPARRQLLLFDHRRDVIDTLTLVVCEHYKASVRDVRSNSRRRSLAFMRWVIMWLARALTDLRQEDIGQVLARDHSSVHHGLDEIETRLAYDPFFRRAMATLVETGRARLAALGADG